LQKEDEVERDDIEKLAQILGSEITHSRSREVKMTCPFPGCGHRAFVVEATSGASRCYCFFCSQGGRLSRVLRALNAQDGETYGEAYRFVSSTEAGSFLPPKITKKKRKMDPSLFRIFQASRGDISEELKARGVLDREVKKWKLGFDSLRNRDMFPVYDIEGTLRAIQGRRIGDNPTEKYITFGAYPEVLSDYFYGEQFLDVTRGEGVGVEGALDTIVCSRYLPNTLGFLGSDTLTEERKKRLKQWFTSFTLLFDHDEAGVLSMFKIGSELSRVLSVFVAMLPKGKDPGEASAEEIREAYARRRLWSLVQWSALCDGVVPRFLDRRKKRRLKAGKIGS